MPTEQTNLENNAANKEDKSEALEPRRTQFLGERRDRAKRRKRLHSSPVYRSLRWAAAPLKVATTAVRRFRFAILRAKALKDYTSTAGFKGLHIGCGPNRIENWLNTDVLVDRLPWRASGGHESAQDFPLDITKKLPLEDSSFDAIYGEEVIEHIEKVDAEYFFVEARRILRDDGVLRLTTPDLVGTCRAFLHLDKGVDPSSFEPYWLEGDWSEEAWINDTFRSFGHLYIWNFRTIRQELLKAGFSDVWRVKQGETSSGKPELDGIERRTPDSESDFGRFMEATRLIIEARR